jgi:hypothetical protein
MKRRYPGITKITWMVTRFLIPAFFSTLIIAQRNHDQRRTSSVWCWERPTRRLVGDQVGDRRCPIAMTPDNPNLIY